VWCRPKTLGHENKYPYLRIQRILVCDIFDGNQKPIPFLNRDRGVYIPIGVVIDDPNILDLYNCIIYML